MEYKKSTQEILEKVTCPFSVFSEENTVEEVNLAYKKAAERGKQEGFVPVLVVADETMAEWLGILGDDQYSKEAVLGKVLDGKQVLQERLTQYLEDYKEDYGEPEQDRKEAEFFPKEFLGEKTGGEELEWLTSFMDYRGEKIQETIQFEIPLNNPWE